MIFSPKNSPNPDIFTTAVPTVAVLNLVHSSSTVDAVRVGSTKQLHLVHSSSIVDAVGSTKQLVLLSLVSLTT